MRPDRKSSLKSLIKSQFLLQRADIKISFSLNLYENITLMTLVRRHTFLFNDNRGHIREETLLLISLE